MTAAAVSVEDIHRVLLDFFAARGGLPGDTSDEKLDCAYLWAGVITSVGLVELVMTLERTFGIRFQADDMQSESFHTCRGLAELVANRLADPP